MKTQTMFHNWKNLLIRQFLIALVHYIFFAGELNFQD